MFFFFNDTATTEIYTLSLHDALPIFGQLHSVVIDTPDPHGLATFYAQLLGMEVSKGGPGDDWVVVTGADRKSTRLNSSHANISYAVFCLKKKKPPHSITLH